MKDAKGHGSNPRGVHQAGVDQIGRSPTRPTWWSQPSDNAFAKGMTQGQVTEDWLKRHNVPQTADGKYVFYHATPLSNKLTSIRAGSQLETDPKAASFFAGRDRGLKAKDITVHRLTLDAHEIHTGVWASLRKDHKI